MSGIAAQHDSGLECSGNSEECASTNQAGVAVNKQITDQDHTYSYEFIFINHSSYLVARSLRGPLFLHFIQDNILGIDLYRNMKFPLPLPTLLGALTLLTPAFSANTLNIVAHPDDDLLFLNPDIQNDISSGFNVRTVYLTSGDAGQPYEYWTLRQAGLLTAYAQMAGVESIWDESDAGVAGKDIPVYTLRPKPEVSLAFMHIPDGSMDGNGFPATGQESLEKLWKGAIARIRTVDASGTTYSRGELVETLRQIIDSFVPDSLNSLDYVHPYGSGDHSDHTSAGLFTNTAAITSSFPGSVIAYRGYPIKSEPANVGGEDLVRKKEVFYTYAAFDEDVCGSDQACAGKEYELWLPKQYTAN